MPSSRNITLYVDQSQGITLRLLYNICVHAQANHKELDGIQPLRRHECGLAIPFGPLGVHKIKLLLGWNRGRCHALDCAWNIFIPKDWQNKLPSHRLFDAGISSTLPHLESNGSWEERQKELDAKADGFARCMGRPSARQGCKVIATLDCSYGNHGVNMPDAMFNALRQCLKEMGLCDKPPKKEPEMKWVIPMYINRAEDLTMELIYKICTYAQEHYKDDLNGIRPQQRVEVGLGIPEGGSTREYKAKLVVGSYSKWRSLDECADECWWNLWVPGNWREELPMHELFHTSISRTQNQGFAYSPSKFKKHGDKYVAYLDCRFGAADMPLETFNALKRCISDMGLAL